MSIFKGPHFSEVAQEKTARDDERFAPDSLRRNSGKSLCFKRGLSPIGEPSNLGSAQYFSPEQHGPSLLPAALVKAVSFLHDNCDTDSALIWTFATSGFSISLWVLEPKKENHLSTSHHPFQDDDRFRSYSMKCL